MHPRFAQRRAALLQPHGFRVPSAPPKPEVWETFRLPDQPAFVPSIPVVAHLVHQHLISMTEAESQAFWDATLKRSLDQYRKR